MEKIQTRKPNSLITEKSPYLLQHAYNPVEWHPWGSQAFDSARKNNKPVFLSIGYSTCHWCHVMEKESFENEQVAKLMNDAFVCIKVDREERPDLDGIYMAACQKMTGNGGWPLNLILTPDKKPFFAATYIPRESKFGHVGLIDLIPRIKDIWENRRNDVEETAMQVLSVLREEKTGRGELNSEVLHDAFEQLLSIFDDEHGGFGDSPKFPTAQNLLFLLRYWKRTGDKMALLMVEKTLSAMRAGGIYDHIGFGFCRYSTDSRWLVPHFEKMLYDQAMIAFAYAEAYQATRKEEYAETAREIFTYVLRDMTSKEGGFYSGEDADSEGEEGKFYLWTEDEIDSLLSKEEANLIKKSFNVEKKGSFPEGEKEKRNILHLIRPISSIASDLKMPIEDFEKRIEMARKKLFSARDKRVHPGKDDKVLADWNGLMIAALAKGAHVFDEPEYAAAAKRSLDFIISGMGDTKGRLFHRYRDGESAIPAFLDDYAFLVWGLIELYEATFEISYLRAALEFNEVLLNHFLDKDNGGFYFTADDAEDVLVRKKEIYDGAIPSGNSVQMLNLLRLSRITGNMGFEEIARGISRAFSGVVSASPAAYCMLMSALDLASGSNEVVIAGDLNAEDTKGMLAALRREFLPDMVVIHRPPDKYPEICRIAGYTLHLTPKGGRATAFVCKNFSCKMPTNDPGDMIRLIISEK